MRSVVHATAQADDLLSPPPPVHEPAPAHNSLACAPEHSSDEPAIVAEHCESASSAGGKGSAEDASSKQIAKRKADERCTEGKKRKDEKSSASAKKREFTRFKKYFDVWQSNEPPMPSSWPAVDDELLQLIRDKIETDPDMSEHMKKRLEYVLNEENSAGKNYADLMWMAIKSFGQIPRGFSYERRYCHVCKVAERVLVKLVDDDTGTKHDCPYCRECFDGSGYKQECHLLTLCDKKTRST